MQLAPLICIRAGLAAACILIRAGIPYPLEFPAISRARRVKVPDTEEQESWVQAFAKAHPPLDSIT